MGAIIHLLIIWPLLAAPPERYATVRVERGEVQITTQSGRRIIGPKDSEQVGAEMPAVSADRQSVGWIALYNVCAQSYPCPIKLIVLRNGHVHKFVGAQPIYRWCFLEGGKRVAFESEFPHGGYGVSYHLFDVATERELGFYVPPTVPPTVKNRCVLTDPDPNRPKWVDELNASTNKR
jgi:hypothetical protein